MTIRPSILEHRGPNEPSDRRYTSEPRPTGDMRFLLVLVRLSGMKPKDRVLVWRRVNELGATAIIRSAFTLADDREGRERAEGLVRLIEEKGGRAWLFSAEPHSKQDRQRIEELIYHKMENEVKEFLEECDEFITDLSKELREEEFEFYELEELGDDLRKLEKWKTKLMEKYPSARNLYERLEVKFEECRKLFKIFERKCLEKSARSGQ